MSEPDALNLLADPRNRASGKDIVELFGYAPNDCSEEAIQARAEEKCPFMGYICDKKNHDGTVIYGACAVTNGTQKAAGTEVIICPKRLYAGEYKTLKDIALMVWGTRPADFVIGGSFSDLREKSQNLNNPVIAFGHDSGVEVSISSNAGQSIDWVIQRYSRKGSDFIAEEFVCVEVQSIDTTGNYRANHQAYMSLVAPGKHIAVPNSEHGLNFANVHKRLIPQLIRKGNVIKMIPRCRGLFFILPDEVYNRFENVIGAVPKQKSFGQENLSVITYKLGAPEAPGRIRSLARVRVAHYSLDDVAKAFIKDTYSESAASLDLALNGFLNR